MIYGIVQNSDMTCFTANTGNGNGFTLIGRGKLSGSYVAQMYEVTSNMPCVNLSYTVSDDVSALYFSIWKISGGSAKMLTSKTDGWTAGQKYSFTVIDTDETSTTVSAGDRLVLIWGSMAGGDRKSVV